MTAACATWNRWFLSVAFFAILLIPLGLTGARTALDAPTAPRRIVGDKPNNCLRINAAGDGLTTQDMSEGVTAQQLVSTLVNDDSGMVISNIHYTGGNTAAGLFSGGQTILGFESGIVLSSGKIDGIIGPNNGLSSSPQNTPGDEDLSEVSNKTTYDASVLEFDFVPESDKVSFRYVFGSEEYNEYVNQFNDAFAFFINGTNYALLPNGDPVTIDNVNLGKNSEYYRNNEIGETATINCRLDGLTVVLSFEAPVNPGQVNHIKLVIADALDRAYDSAVMIQAGSMTAYQADLELEKTVNNPTQMVGRTVNYQLKVTNTGPKNANDVKVKDLLPAGLQYRSSSGPGTYDPQTGIWTIGALPLNESVTLNIVAKIMLLQTITNVAEVYECSMPDPDSEPGNGNAEEDDYDSVIINPTPNPPPVAESTHIVVHGRIPFEGMLHAIDPSNDPEMTYSIVQNGTRGTAVITDSFTGAFTYTANANVDGTDQFTFKANDGINDSNIATVQVTILHVDWKPDMWLRIQSAIKYSGDDIYSENGFGQTKTQNAAVGAITRYVFRVQNDGNYQDTYRVTVPAALEGWGVRFFDLDTKVEITKQIFSANGWKTPLVQPAETKGFYVEIMPRRRALIGTKLTQLVTAVSSGDSTVKDAGKTETTAVADFLPDAQIRNVGEDNYIGDDLYGCDGAEQAAYQTVAIGTIASYIIRAQNDATSTDGMLITAPAGDATWTVKYYDVASGADITTAVTGDGWNTGILAPGASRHVRVNVTPSLSAPTWATRALVIRAHSTVNEERLDVVRAVTTAKTTKPDVWIRTNAEANYTGDNIYSASAIGQIKTQMAANSASVFFLFRVQNDGCSTDSFTVTAPGGNANWVLTYRNIAGNADLTGAVTGSGWNTGPLLPGMSAGVWVQVMPNAAALPNEQFTALLTAVSNAQPLTKDAARFTTTVFRRQPDLWVRTTLEANYTGDNVYNLNGADQTCSRTLPAGQPAIFLFRVQNDGNTTDTFTVTGPAGGSGWTVTYYDTQTGLDVTPLVTWSMWKAEALAPGASLGLWVKVTPQAALANEASNTLALTAVSAANPAQKDVVKVTVTKQNTP